MFPGVTVRKDLVNKVKGNALVPSYVLEFLLSAYATNTDQASIESGVDRVRAIPCKQLCASRGSQSYPVEDPREREPQDYRPCTGGAQ
ncbi:MAG: anti-phage BREX system Lon protease BrxL [Bifidobacterium bifidum]|nr:anti-phage BREX system Lon protease BrxL [Bifidobacterium bifidum]